MTTLAWITIAAVFLCIALGVGDIAAAVAFLIALGLGLCKMADDGEDDDER